MKSGPIKSRKALTLVSSYYLVILVKHITIINKWENGSLNEVKAKNEKLWLFINYLGLS